MVKKVIFTKRAGKEIQRLISYLKKEWSESSAEKFVSILDDKITNIQNFPNSYPKFEQRPDIRKCVILKQVSLYYKFDNNIIEVVTLFDNRQALDKLEM